MPLPLPIAPQVALAKIIDPALEQLPRAMDSDRAALLLLVIALQESGFLRRQQLGHGPARGLWQFERGGCDAVMGSPLCKPFLPPIFAQHAVPRTAASLYLALAADDILACKIARLLLWSDRAALPAIGDRDAAWAYYVRNWRPGEPRPKDWDANYQLAMHTLGID